MNDAYYAGSGISTLKERSESMSSMERGEGCPVLECTDHSKFPLSSSSKKKFTERRERKSVRKKFFLSRAKAQRWLCDSLLSIIITVLVLILIIMWIFLSSDLILSNAFFYREKEPQSWLWHGRCVFLTFWIRKSRYDAPDNHWFCVDAVRKFTVEPGVWSKGGNHN